MLILGFVRMYHISMGKPMGYIVSHNGKPFASNERITTKDVQSVNERM